MSLCEECKVEGPAYIIRLHVTGGDETELASVRVCTECATRMGFDPASIYMREQRKLRVTVGD